MCKACQPIRSHFSCKTSQELEFFALFNAVHSIELMSRGYAIEYTELQVLLRAELKFNQSHLTYFQCKKATSLMQILKDCLLIYDCVVRLRSTQYEKENIFLSAEIWKFVMRVPYIYW